MNFVIKLKCPWFLKFNSIDTSENPPSKWLSFIAVGIVPLVIGLVIGYVKWYVPRRKNRQTKGNTVKIVDRKGKKENRMTKEIEEGEDKGDEVSSRLTTLAAVGP